ncbi:MAG: DNA repair protein RecO [Gammaproteobacteria bacterium]|nr:DNA repair protein RecO [Gammaproteobacteria bacterium]
MGATQISLQPAFMLHGRPYRDTSLLLDILTPDHGRVSLVARGVRRPRSALPALLQPFTPLLMSWTGRHELKTMISAERDGAPWRLAGRQMASGFYANELLLRLLGHEDPHPRLFDHYGRLLGRLLQSPQLAADPAALLRHEEQALRVFEKYLLDELGYGLQLERDAVSGMPLQPGQHYNYHLDHGPVILGGADPLGNEPSIAISGAALRALAMDTVLEPQCLQQCKQLMRMVLKPLLGERPLYSRQLFRGLHTPVEPATNSEQHPSTIEA